MKANPLFVAAVVLVILGAAVYYTSQNPPADGKEDRAVLIDVKYEDIQGIEIRRPNGEKLSFMRGEEDRWEFAAGYEFPADDAAVGLMATNLDQLSADRVVQDSVSDWRPFGLEDEGNLAVSMTPQQGEPVTVIFGNETPTGAGVFARTAGEPRLFTVYNYVKTSFDKTVFELRDKRILQFESEDVETVSITVNGGRFRFESAGPGEWRILEPSPARADDFVVGELVRAIQAAEMTQVMTEERAAALSPFFSRPFARVEVSADGEHSIEIAGRGGEYFAKTSDLAGVFAVSPGFAETLNRDLDDLRERKLFDFGFDPVRVIEIRDQNLDRSIRVLKGGEDWLLATENDRVLDAELVQTLIDALRNLSAAEFVSEDESMQSASGLGRPTIEATVVSGSEPDDVSETVRLTDPTAARVLASRKGEPSTYRVEQAASQELRRALDALLRPDPPQESEPMP